MAPSSTVIACGGLDNLCTLYEIPAPASSENKPQKLLCELAHHEGYLSCVQFLDNGSLLTSSGDSSCLLWDLNKKSYTAEFNDHTSDVMNVSLFKPNGTFLSGSVDATCKLWDYRVKRNCIKTFHGHESDVNHVSTFPDGNAFATASDDSSCRLFDIRAYRCLNVYHNEKILCGVTSCAFSYTATMLFAGYDDYNCFVWDTRRGTITAALDGHEHRVSCVSVSPTGEAMASGCWDSYVKVLFLCCV